MYSYDTYGMDGALAGLSAGWIVFCLIIAGISIAAMWLLFQKAGEPGWAAIVPIYNAYVYYKITWGSGWYFLLMLIPLANIVIGIMTYIKLAQAFGKGGGWAVGLIFLGPIFLCIMAFDKSIVYVGVPGKTAAYGGYPAGGQQGGYQYPYQQGYQNPYQNNGQLGYQSPYQNNGQQGYPAQGWQQNAQNPGYGGYQQTPPVQGGVMYCPACGARLPSGSRFCTQCGKEFQ